MEDAVNYLLVNCSRFKKYFFLKNHYEHCDCVLSYIRR